MFVYRSSQLRAPIHQRVRGAPAHPPSDAHGFQVNISIGTTTVHTLLFGSTLLSIVNLRKCFHRDVFPLRSSSCPLRAGIVIPMELQTRATYTMLADKPYRWTNCGDSCSPGFVSAPGSGGASNEMMWGHSHCKYGSLSQMCCPANAPQTTCTWRGHANSGKCTPRCKNGEAEVWTINVGCKSGHQSACYTTSTSSIEAYASCRWQGTAPNCWGDQIYHPLDTCDSPTFRNVAVEAPAGFGGSDTRHAGMFFQLSCFP
ncbi:hypothetical protein EK21DRAFT_88961 [Setomelanomma holmii]|uniref:Uncharacterized protein n=1 Tax=Setomelanomma holmii TaxID=210430 RepID=A0A9P4HA37_9PLEO|nr:hypothetical protein EK21DRAFT_88961 [Setomelanomma holmii]